MGTGKGIDFGNTRGGIEHQIDEVSNVNTSIVWDHISGTQPNYPGTIIPKSFVVDTPTGKMWTHGNASEHMFEAVTSIKSKIPQLINSNPNLYSQFVLFDYWKSLGDAVHKGIKYDVLVTSGNWEFKFSKPRHSGDYPVVKHAKFTGFR